MNLLELHILQSFPFTCLNRDDKGSPKTCWFGGVQRARVSSQSWKRAIRERARELESDLFQGCRSLLQAQELSKLLQAKGLDIENVDVFSQSVLNSFTQKGDDKKATLLYLSPAELQAVAGVVEEFWTSGTLFEVEETSKKKTKKKTDSDEEEQVTTTQKKIFSDKFKKAVSSAVKESVLSDALDICLFGRMTAADASVTLEGASMFSHAISTHEATEEVDYFTALDDLKPQEESGAGHLGENFANSACYYRDIHVNLDLLFNDDHFGKATDEEKRRGLEAFIRATLESVPHARQNTMFGHSVPSYVLGIVRNGSARSFANAFEEPVQAKKDGGYIETSKERLEAYYADHVKVFDSSFKDAQEFKIGKNCPVGEWLTSIVDACMEKVE